VEEEEEGEEDAWRKVKREWMGLKEGGMGRRKGLERGKDEEEGIGMRKGLGGGRDGEETPRRVDGIRKDGIVMTGRSDHDDGETGFVCCSVYCVVVVIVVHCSPPLSSSSSPINAHKSRCSSIKSRCRLLLASSSLAVIFLVIVIFSPVGHRPLGFPLHGTYQCAPELLFIHQL